MAKEKKKSMKTPHVVFLLIALMIVMCLLTYVLPAGQFIADANGVNQYVRVERSPVSPLRIASLIFEGTVNSGTVIALLFMIGASTTVITETKAIDHLIDYLMYRLQDRGVRVLVPSVFILLTFISAFAFEGAIAVFPVAIMLVKKLRLDPMTAAGLTVLCFVVGFATSPTSCYVAQSLMDVPIYSGFGVRMLNLIHCTAIGAVYVTIYARRVERDPSRSVMKGTAWMTELDTGVVELEKKTVSANDIIIVVLFFAQYVAAVLLNLKGGMGLKALPAVMIPVGILCGLIGRMSFDQIGNAFLKGVKGMADICLIIGMAGAIALIMKNGMILDTIAYYLSLPLRGLSSGMAAIGIAGVVALINILVPSASAKAAALIPIIKPMAASLGLAPQVTVQAFQVGDGMMNGVSPFMGTTLGVLDMCKVDYRRWLKWFLPLCALYYVVEFIFLFVVTSAGWA